ncbi:hypothetical protein ACFLXB_00950 [Chloroflexota bacterium]
MATNSLRKIILEETGQDLRQCRGCLACDLDGSRELDIGYASLVQMVLHNDLEVLETKLVWNDAALDVASKATNKDLDLRVVITTLRNINDVTG